MKINYKGFEIKVWQEESLGGWDNLYYYVMRIEDGYMLDEGFSEGKDKLKDFCNDLKQLVDEYLEHPSWYEDEFD